MKVRNTPRAPELLTGRAGSGKTARCVALFREKILASPDAGLRQSSYFILPSREHADRIYSILLRDARFKGVLNLHVCTINEFIRMKVRASRTRTLSHFDRARFANEILASGEWPWLGASRETKGLAFVLADFIREVKRTGFGTSAFRGRGVALAKRDPYYARKHADLVRFMERYDAICEERGFRDPEDEVREFAAAVEDGRESPVLDLTVFDGFFAFTGVQHRFVEALAARSRETIVTLTLDRVPARAQVFGYPLRTRDRLLAAGFVEKRLAVKNFRFKSPGLARLEAAVFGKGPARRVAPGSIAGVALFEAPNPRAEIETIAREIRRLVREGDHAWSDFMIVLRDVESCRDAYERTLSEFGVPCEVHERKRLADHALVRYLLSWAALTGPGGGTARWIDYLRNEFAGFDPRTIDEIEAAFAASAAAEGSGFPELAPGARLSEAAAAVWNETRSDWEAYHAIPDAAGFRRFFESLIARRAGPSEGQESGEEDVVLETIAAVLDDIAFDSARGGAFSAAAAGDRFASQLESGLYSPPGPEKNRVQIYDVSLALQKEYRVVFVAGLEDKRFPRPPQPEPVLKSAEREHFNAQDALFDTRVMRASGERYYFYMAVTRARERLCLTRALADADGQDIPESPFLMEAKRCLGGDLRPAGAARPEDAISAREFARVFATCASTGEDAPLLGAAAEVLRRSSDSAGAADLAARFRALKRPCALEAPEALADLRDFSRPISANRLAKIANCGYQHFAHYLLGFREEDPKTGDLQSGQVLHRVLEKALCGIFEAKRKGPPSADELRAAFERELDAAFAEFPVPGERPYRAARRHADIARSLGEFAEREAGRFAERPGFVPVPDLIEKEFRFRFDLKDAGPLIFTGQIDRVDRDAEGRAFVVDYKKKNRVTHKELKAGENAQALLYLLAAEKELGLTPVGMEFVSLEDKSIGRIALNLPGGKPKSGQYGWWNADEFAEALDRAKANAAASVRKLKEADIRAVSVKCGDCRYHTLCRFEGWRSA